ncbi:MULTISPECIES: ABC transporter substrate-binding protein [unclassified Campylobacter]|uniref:ABC transporter substrate-binding protein n=1 Tax=unclassified Campylobacter TaxID=2593542 RepID=UPI0012382A5A|nr:MULTISPECIES: ABC transporter substrate-binding protein [unclassified Campylobacter]KAA6224978.1 ABC transporter substrate-binding protein [Campylobacter sp. LR196d]KAA6225300.1 ABC transporter substrate-binding protein [Campylobacter sp. LR286c]KAA6225581.1 ABC transporter substrate-binding protein [Campylobacter sp. LR185c]KAA6230425.1 ABC transporter substrate-binding protein [Campylobacter sp. LR291e]KAA6230549.1 ABC transporter substrate-binding protein [Campylobacter sp. LR264d]
MKKILLLCIFLSTIFANQRLIVLDPASIETLFMLESGDKIVGMAHLQHSKIYPEDKTKEIQSVGSFSHPSIEKIVSLKPSLVILSSYSLNLEESLKNYGIKSLYLKADNLDDINDNIKTLASIVGKEKEGQILMQNFKNNLEELSKNPINKSAIYLFSSNPLMAFSDNSLMADILRLLGIKNLTPKSDIKRPIISNELILKTNPDMLILGIASDNINELIEKNSLLKNVNAVKNKQIFYNEDTRILLRLSPKIIDRIKEFKNRLENL